MLIVGVVLWAIASHGWRIEGLLRAPPDPELNEVVVYVTADCPWCARTLERLDAWALEYRVRDIERSATARHEFEALGGRGVPLVIVNGALVHGHDPRALARHLRREAPATGGGELLN